MRTTLFFITTILLLLMTATMISSCASFDRESIIKLNEMKAQQQRLGNEIADVIEFISETKIQIAEIIKQGKEGKISAEDVSEMLSILHERLEAGQEHLNQLQTEYDKTKIAIKDLHESGVPWWQIGLWGLLAIFNVATGRGYLKEKGNGQVADLAIQGIGGVVKILENVYTKKYHNTEVRESLKVVKDKIFKLNNPIIEGEVAKLPNIPIIEPPPEEEPPAEVESDNT